MRTVDLEAVADALEVAAGATTTANSTEGGRWKRIALAAEALAGASTSANSNTIGYMRRAAVALESIAGTSGAEENDGVGGLKKRIVDALEVQAGAVGTSSIDSRMVAAAAAATFAYTFVNAEAETYVAAMLVEPDDTRKALIDTFVGDLVTAGVWAKLDWLNPLAAHDAQAALLNAVNPAKSLIAVNAPTFTIDRGYTGNGANAYLDWGELPNAAGNNYALNNACVGAWCNLQGASTITQYHIGVTAGSSIVLMQPNAVSSEVFRINDGSSQTLQATTGTRTGHRSASRTAAASKRGYAEGVVTYPGVTASTAVPTGNLCALRLAGTYSDDRLACVYSGGGMTDTEMADLHAALSTYLTAIGAN